MSEEAKVALRNIRQDALSDVKKLELSEDEEKRACDGGKDRKNRRKRGLNVVHGSMPGTI